MEERVRRALERDLAIDITTTGRKSGQPRRAEIWFHNLDDRIYITGLPGRRDWYANLRADPRLTFHLKESTVADLPARATLVTDPTERRAVFTRILERLDRSADLDAWMADSPLIEVKFDDSLSA